MQVMLNYKFIHNGYSKCVTREFMIIKKDRKIKKVSIKNLLKIKQNEKVKVI